MKMLPEVFTKRIDLAGKVKVKSKWNSLLAATNLANMAGNQIDIGRGERIRTSGLYVPNVALYQAKLHPELNFRNFA